MKTKNVKNNTVGALIFFTLFCLAPGMVGAAVQSSTAHSSVVLKDYQGKNVESSKLPVSYIASCGSCHDIDYINQGYHFQMGREATLSAGAYKTFRMKYADGGNAFLPPAEQENLSLPWFLHRPIYSSGGMYGRVAMNHTQKLAPVTTDDPLKLTFTTPDQATDICSNCHAGGGYHLEDREGNKLAARDGQTIAASLAAGIFQGDYLKFDRKNGAIAPYDWKAKAGAATIPNTREIDCLLCHAADYSFEAARNYLNKGMAAWAATAGARLGTINPDGTVDYNHKRLQGFSAMLGKTTTETCSRCHAGALDVDGDHLITLNDNVSFSSDKNLNNSPGFKKRAQMSGTGVATVHGVLQRVYDPAYDVSYYDPAAKAFTKVPYLDVHVENGVQCVDCHAPRDQKKNISRPNHDFGKGTAGFNVRTDLSGATRCEQCHATFQKDHAPFFGPQAVAASHLEKIHCTTCHIPQKFGIVGESVMKDRSNDGKPDSFKNVIELEGYGPVAVPASPDYVYFPDRDFKTGDYTIKIKPANVMTEMYWALEDGTPVPERMLAAVFKTAPESFNRSNGAQTLFKLQYFKDGKPYRTSSGLPVQTERVMSYSAAVIMPIQIAKAMNIPAQASLVGKIAQGAPVFDTEQEKTGWVVLKAAPNLIVNPITAEKMLIRADDKEWTLIDRSDEITFAATALQAAYKKINRAEVRIKYVYHLSILDGGFIMSHNVAPLKGGAPERKSQRVLQCADCHALSGAFNRPVKLGVPIDTVDGITEFEMPRQALRGYEGVFTEADLRALTYAYYSPSPISAMLTGTDARITDVWTRADGGVAHPVEVRKPSSQPADALESFTLSLPGGQTDMKLWNNRTGKPLDTLLIAVSPASSEVQRVMRDNVLILTLKKPELGDQVLVTISRKTKHEKD